MSTTSTEVRLCGSTDVQRLRSQLPKRKPAKANLADAITGYKALTKGALLTLVQSGYVSIPLLPVSLKQEHAGKVPAFFERGEWLRKKDWPTLVKKAGFDGIAEMIDASPSIPNLGILCGEPVKRGARRDGEHVGFLAGIDIDCAAPELVDALSKLFGNKFACRKGNATRSGCVPVVLAIDTLDNTAEVYHRKGTEKEHIQLLKAGKQFAAFGGHPSGVPYRWEDATGGKRDIPAIRDLPVITLGELESVLSDNGFIRGTGKSGTKLDGKVKHLEAQRLLRLYRDGGLPSFECLTEGDEAPYDGEVLSTIAAGVETQFEDEEINPDNGIQSRNAARLSFTNRVRRKYPGMGIEYGFAVCLRFDAVCGEFVTSGKTTGQYTTDQFVKDWNNASTANQKAHEAKMQEKALRKSEAFGSVVPDVEREVYQGDVDQLDDEAVANLRAELRATEAKVKELQREKASKSTAPSSIIMPSAPALMHPDEFAPRPLLYGGMLMRGAFTVFAGAGGAAKSLSFLGMGADMVTGLETLGRKVQRELRVLVYDGEDSKIEMDKRLSAMAHFHNLTGDQKAKIATGMALQSGTDNPLLFAGTDNRKFTEYDDTVKRFVEYLRDNKFDVALLGPLSTLHSIEENDNSGMHQFGGLLNRIALKADVALGVNAHVRKPQGKDKKITAMDVRGASAAVNSSRGVWVYKTPDAKDVKKHNLAGDAFDYVIIGNGNKNNYGKRGSGTSVILKIETVTADNATAEYAADVTPVLSLVKADVTEHFDAWGDEADKIVKDATKLVDAWDVMREHDEAIDFLHDYLCRLFAALPEPVDGETKSLESDRLRNAIGEQLDNYTKPQRRRLAGNASANAIKKRDKARRAQLDLLLPRLDEKGWRRVAVPGKATLITQT